MVVRKQQNKKENIGKERNRRKTSQQIEIQRVTRRRKGKIDKKEEMSRIS